VVALAVKKEHIFIDGKEMKECSRCKMIKELSMFRKDKGKWDGLYPYCKECSSTKDKEVYRKNPSKKKATVKQYMIRTGKIREYKPYNPKYYSSVKSRLKKRARDLRRRALKKDADLEFVISHETIIKIIKKYNGKCAYCNKDCSDNFHIDHKVPLSRGGGNEFENLALSCPRCNFSKKDKTDVEFVGRKV
jgi:5-methylcytosine-specific restriction endonuclease McrA